MCLYTNWLLPRKTKEWTTVYKVVKVKGKRKRQKHFYTPVTKEEVYLYQEYTANGPKTSTVPRVYAYYRCFTNRWEVRAYPVLYSIPVYIIERGYIHCCATIDTAVNWAKKNNHLLFSRYAVIKCLVPPGTLYYKSLSKTDDLLCVRSLITREIVLKCY